MFFVNVLVFPKFRFCGRNRSFFSFILCFFEDSMFEIEVPEDAEEDRKTNILEQITNMYIDGNFKKAAASINLVFVNEETEEGEDASEG